MSDGLHPPRLIAAGLILTICAIGCGWLATRFEHVGAPLLYICAGIFGLATVALAARRYSAWVFAVIFCGTATAAGLVGAALLALDALATRRSGQGALLNVFEILGVVVLLPGALLLLTLTIRLVRKPPTFALPDVPRAYALPLAVVAMTVLAYTFGFEGYWKMMPEREACLAENLDSCVRLAMMDERFTVPERADYARFSCERGEQRACTMLTDFLGPKDDPAGVNEQVLKAQCERGRAPVCAQLGTALALSGRTSAGAGFLVRGCELDVETCRAGAQALERRGAVAMMRTLLVSGCERREMQSCRLLLIRFGETLDEPVRKALGLEVCLATDVNDCLRLMREDAAAVCPVICDGGGGVNRRQSCDYCGRTARDGRRIALATEWFGGNCRRGYPTSCENLGDMLLSLGRPAEALPWFAKACELDRAYKSGCAKAGELAGASAGKPPTIAR